MEKMGNGQAREDLRKVGEKVLKTTSCPYDSRGHSLRYEFMQS